MLNYFHSLAFTWWQWLFIYAILGLLLSTYHLIQTYKNRHSEFARNILKTIHGKKTFADRLVDGFAYTFAAVLMLIGWPVAILWNWHQSREEAKREIESNKPDFNCSSEYLIAKVDPHDAELASYVTDPLFKVPAIPFGHLNQAWGNFLADMLDEGDELWSFHIQKGSQCGKHRFPASGEIRGYAKVRRGEILGEFITESD
jgi:hypothetical protein